MEEDIRELKAKLKEANQEHILDFWDELDEDEKESLVKQIQKTDFSKITERYEKSKEEEYFDINEISPLPYVNSNCMDQDQKEKYIKIGEEIIKRGEVAVISMAGGQRNKTRLPWT
ncbi:MAG: hypothetical protein IKP28_06460 [Clostridia bacterium]|nr:hypothetical protein [Clostridia bacterium]